MIDEGPPWRTGTVAVTEEILGQFLGDASFPVTWDAEVEKDFFWVYDDLHCPHPVSPMFFDIGGWWLSCDHMFRRFGTPFAVDWLAKNVNGYVYTTAIPADPDLRIDATEYSARYGARVPRDAAFATTMGAYLDTVLPVYGRDFATGGGTGCGPRWSVISPISRRASTLPTAWIWPTRPASSRTPSTSTTATGRSTGCSTSPSCRRRSTSARSCRRRAARSTRRCWGGSRTRPRTATGTRSRRCGG